MGMTYGYDCSKRYIMTMSSSGYDSVKRYNPLALVSLPDKILQNTTAGLNKCNKLNEARFLFLLVK